MLFRFVGLKECGLGTQSLGLAWPLSEVGTQVVALLFQFSPPQKDIWVCHPGPETENTTKYIKFLIKIRIS